MIHRSTLIHLRLPFSIFLLPIYLFALSQSQEVFPAEAISVFFILHFMVYPASNGYNSYFDKDKGSIGGIKSPPSVSRQLYFVSLTIDALALLISFKINWNFGLGVLLYGLASKAYSHPAIRLKKYPVIGWLTIGVFQGFLVYIISYLAINRIDLENALQEAWIPATLASLLLLGSYPMTQIYQHDEDESRGDKTISSRLGILGTFHFTAVFFTIAITGFLIFFLNEKYWLGIGFIASLLPTLAFFLKWYFKVRNDRKKANYENTMILNLISSISLTVFFALVAFFRV